MTAARAAQWVSIIVLLVLSEAVSIAGHVTASYAVDAVAVVVYLGFRRYRR